MPRVRIGVLTGGGDCPGLNAAIRAIVRKGIDQHGHAFVGFRDGWRGTAGKRALRADDRVDARDPAPRRHHPRHLPDQSRSSATAGPEQLKQNLAGLGVDGLIAIGGEDTLGAAARLHAEHGVPVVGVPKTIDNDLGGHRPDLRVRHRPARGHRGHRPPAHHGREPQPGDAAGGDGPPRGLDRAALRAGRRRRRDPHPRAPVRHRRGVPADLPPPLARALVLDRGGGRGRRAPRGHDGDRQRRGPTSSATSGSAGSGRAWRARSSPARATRPGPRCSDTPSAAARRPPTTGCWPPASASPRSTPPTPATGARWPPCAVRRSSWWTLADAVSELRTVPDADFDAAETFFG